MSALAACDPPDEVEKARLREAMRRRVEASGTSFFSAMRLLAPERRAAMYAIYAFCREVDDIADEGLDPATKEADLAAWRAEIDALYEGRPTREVARALLDPVRRFGLRREDFLAVIDGMAMDAAADIRAPSAADLDLYCDRVASAVGRLSVRAFGAGEPAADDVAHHLGRALQLTNILRDLAEDAARGRLYLPRELLEQHGIHGSDPATVLSHPDIGGVCDALAAEARGHYARAAAAMARCARGPLKPARVMGAVYAAILDGLCRRGWKRLDEPVRLPRLRKIWLALRHGLL
ncbi:MAG: presqualene diphosphate synthase HpnD [Alphaproteobacteria bacterium]|nr:presqualene diphosphate synthase HpnD [Alphaproteobacteria bacterium]